MGSGSSTEATQQAAGQLVLVGEGVVDEADAPQLERRRAVAGRPDLLRHVGGGLTMTTAPSTEAILGSLPRAKAGVGSAMNDTTRELGGTLGVAVVGSVFSSLYGPRIVERLAGLPIPTDALEAARDSVPAALAVAEAAPPEGRALIIEATREAFMDGLSAGVRVAAIATALAALVAWRFLPARGVNPDAPVSTSDEVAA